MPSRMPRSATPSRSAGQMSRIVSRIAQPATTRSARSRPMQAARALGERHARQPRADRRASPRRARSARRPRGDHSAAGRGAGWRASSPCRWCRAAGAAPRRCGAARAAKPAKALGDARAHPRIGGEPIGQRSRRRAARSRSARRRPTARCPVEDARHRRRSVSISTSSVEPPPMSKISAGPSPGSSSMWQPSTASRASSSAVMMSSTMPVSSRDALDELARRWRRGGTPRSRPSGRGDVAAAQLVGADARARRRRGPSPRRCSRPLAPAPRRAGRCARRHRPRRSPSPGGRAIEQAAIVGAEIERGIGAARGVARVGGRCRSARSLARRAARPLRAGAPSSVTSDSSAKIAGTWRQPSRRRWQAARAAGASAAAAPLTRPGRPPICASAAALSSKGKTTDSDSVN